MTYPADGRSLWISWHRDTCTTCESCMVVCSERHTGMSAPSRSRIRILSDALGGNYTARSCRQCKNAPCAAVCPAEAIRFDDEIHVWLVEEDLCTGCGECVEACSFDAIWLSPISGLATKCDLCMGAAWCVEVCPSNALTLRGQHEGDGQWQAVEQADG